MARECPECKQKGLIPLSPTAWGCCLCGYNSDDKVRKGKFGVKKMKLETVNGLRRVTTLFLICIMISYLINSVVDYPLYIDITLAVCITLPINMKVLERLDVEEI